MVIEPLVTVRSAVSSWQVGRTVWVEEDGLSDKDWSVPPQVMVRLETLVDDYENL